MNLKSGKSKALKHMTRHKVSKKIVEMYENTVGDIRSALSRTNWVCTTADAWSGSSRRFLGVTAHWVFIFVLLYHIINLK